MSMYPDWAVTIKRAVIVVVRLTICSCFVVQEHRLYPTAVAALAEGRITWREDGIPIMWTPH